MIDKILSQKVRNPVVDANHENRYVETMYFTRDSESEAAPPSIYLRGKLADSDSVGSRNITNQAISSRHVSWPSKESFNNSSNYQNKVQEGGGFVYWSIANVNENNQDQKKLIIKFTQ